MIIPNHFFLNLSFSLISGEESELFINALNVSKFWRIRNFYIGIIGIFIHFPSCHNNLQSDSMFVSQL